MENVIELDAKTATYEAIAALVGDSINKVFRVSIAGRKLLVFRKCTYQNGQIKTKYRHIQRVREWGGQVVEHLRENKQGNFISI